jgi:hypothetical protein
LMNTIRTCSQPLCQIRRCRHQTFLQVKSRHSLLQWDLQWCHSLTNDSCSLQLNLSRRSEHVSSIGCPSHTHTGENILTDQSGMTTKRISLLTHFYLSLHCMCTIGMVNGEGRNNCVRIVFESTHVLWCVGGANNVVLIRLK